MFVIGNALHNIHSVFSEAPELITGAGVLVGMLIGNRLTIDKDRRTEFNNVAIPIRQALLKQLDGIKGNRPITYSPTREQLVEFKVFLGGFRIRRYCQDIEDYCKCFKHTTYLLPQNKGPVKTFSTVEDLKTLELEILKLLRYCKTK